MLTHDQVEHFHRDGFTLVEGMFSREEVRIVLEAIDRSPRIAEGAQSMPDAEGRASQISLWKDLPDDMPALLSRHPRIVNAMKLLLGDEVYHWHSKIMLKRAHEGGAWEWHQDYGYWYNNGCPYPRLASAMVALDAADEENGCLRVLVGSQHLGRLDHGRVGNQAGADPQRLEAIQSLLPARAVLASAGSVLYFHCNLLHGSGPNRSDRPRRAYIACYNAFSNIPITGQGHGPPVPIQLCDDDAILRYQ